MDIETSSDLSRINSEVQKVRLKNDINITGDFNIIEEFNGVFEGNNYAINNLDTTFIKHFGKNAVLKNVTFKDVELGGNSRGIILENRGELRSVVVEDFTRNKLSEDEERDFDSVSSSLANTVSSTYDVSFIRDSSLLTKNSIGGLVGVNTGTIDDCKIVGLDMNYVKFLHEDWAGIGGISGISVDGEVTDCVVDAKCADNPIYKNWRFSSGICGFAFNTVFDDCKSINFCDCESTVSSSPVNGIVGVGESVTIKNCEMRNWECELSYFQQFNGLALSLNDSIVKNCEITDIDINGTNVVSFVYRNTGVTKNCYFNNCNINSIECSQLEFYFSSEGEVRNCFSNDVFIKTRELTISSSDSNVAYSWIDINLGVTENVNINSKSPNFHVNISILEDEVGLNIKVSSKEDLRQVEEHSIVELTDDIDLHNSNPIDLYLFRGTLNGNGHTISNLRGSLFEVMSNATIKDVVLEGPEIMGEILAESIIDTYIKNIDIKQDDFVTNGDKKNIVVADTVENSRVEDCNVHLKVNNPYLNVHGLCRFLIGSSVKKYDLNIKLKDCSAFCGIASVAKENSIIKNCNCVSEGTVCRTADGLVQDLDSSKIVNTTSTTNILKRGPTTEKGISGLCTRCSDSVVKDCVSNGSIDIDCEIGPVGGIIGQMFKSSKVIGCENNIDIDADSTQIGGIVGRLGDGEVRGCQNFGDIRGIKYIGGIVGLSNTHEDAKTTIGRKSNNSRIVSINRSVNHSPVSGERFIGGLVGFMKNTKLENCYTSGTVEVQEDSGLTVGCYLEDCIINNILVRDLKGTTTEDTDIGTVTDSDLKEIYVMLGL